MRSLMTWMMQQIDQFIDVKPFGSSVEKHISVIDSDSTKYFDNVWRLNWLFETNSYNTYPFSCFLIPNQKEWKEMLTDFLDILEEHEYGIWKQYAK